MKTGKHPTLGKVKLAKLLFFSDAIAYQELGHTIAGVDYIKLPLGPVPIEYNEVLEIMEEDGLIERKHRSTIRGEQEYYIPLVEANLAVFNKKEKGIMAETIRIFRERYTHAVVDLSHKLLPWDVLELGEVISFELFGLDCEEAERLKLKKKTLSTTELIENSNILLASWKKSKSDVKKKKVRTHEWT